MVPFGQLTTSGEYHGRYVEVREELLRRLLAPLLASVEVDEEWYRKFNQDVDDAIRVGKFRSGRDHYIQAGYFEDRLPRPVTIDGTWYLEAYPDVAEAIRHGTFHSVEQHFAVCGFKEGRLPNRQWSLLGSTIEDFAA